MSTTVKQSGFPGLLIDPAEPTREHANAHYRFEPDFRAWGVPLLIGVALLLVSVVGWIIEPAHFFFSYLVGWMFCLTISLGALFFVLIHHLTKAHWGIVIRRIQEVLVFGFPLLAILSIPLWFGLHDLYHWTHQELYEVNSPSFDPILAGKRGYLNVPFFAVRAAIYLTLWSFIAWRLYRLSVEQDVRPDPTIPVRLRRVSAWGVPVYALTVAFASYDFVMSVDPHWFSTIFGVYIFAGSVWVAAAATVLIAVMLQRAGAARWAITVEHYHDLGKWMFAFTVFWAYIAFSQYMLIWYGNIPEETIWYRHRLEHGWQYHSAILLIGHFIAPFILLLPRAIKRSRLLLAAMAVWFLIMQWFDLHWLIMPALHEHGGIHWLDVACWLGLAGVYLAAAVYRLSRHSVVPQHDPRLARSLAFQNI